MLATYACKPIESHGRLHAETESNTRNPFQRDRDRIIHSTAFRRLEYKTQVFVNHEGDHYRTRLTHSLEVAQMARSVCRSLQLHEDLAEALALAHDLGHPPFGHSGEDGLKLAMAKFGGFDHNDHTLRILTVLEQRYAEFDGLNLTWETLEGVAKHNGPIQSCEARSDCAGTQIDPVLTSFAFAKVAPQDWPSAEAQVASLADDIAYNNHDIDDGLRAGLFGVADLEEVPHVASLFHEVQKKYPGIDDSRLIHEAIRRIINRMVTDLITTSREMLAGAKVKTVADIRALGRPVIAFSPAMSEHNKMLKAFLMRRMYRHYKVNRMAAKAKRVVSELFEFFLNQPDCLPDSWQEIAGAAGSQQTATVVADFIAGMTDRFALDEHRRIFDVHARSWLGK